jgi:hypothetical protein
MPRSASRVGLGILAVLMALPASAVIKRLYPLADIIADADSIYPARVAARNTRTHRVTLAPLAPLKGTAPSGSLQVALQGGDDRTQLPLLEQRLPVGRTVLLFGKTKRFALGYTNGTWFRLAEPAAAGKPWQFVHLELYLQRTYRGKTEDLQQLLAQVLAGQATAPPPNPDVKPGVGAP